MFVTNIEVNVPHYRAHGRDGQVYYANGVGPKWEMELMGYCGEPWDAQKIAEAVGNALRQMGLPSVEDVRRKEEEKTSKTTTKRRLTMNLTTAIFLIDSSVRAIKVIYNPDEPHKQYVFKTTDQSLQVDDYVVVPTDIKHKMTVCKVVETDVDVDYDSDIQYKWVVGKVDLKQYEAVLEIEKGKMAEVKKAETLSKRKELRVKLEASNPDLFKDQTPLLVSSADAASKAE